MRFHFDPCGNTIPTSNTSFYYVTDAEKEELENTWAQLAALFSMRDGSGTGFWYAEIASVDELIAGFEQYYYFGIVKFNKSGEATYIRG